MTQRRIYLDHAATSWPKSPDVLDAVDDYARRCGATAGRGGYRSAAEAAAVVARTRSLLAQMIGASSPDTISLHASGTIALNIAIHGVLRCGDHVVTTAAEHNSVLRPLESMRQAGMIDLQIVGCDTAGVVSPADVIAAVTEQTRLVAVTHASNVTGGVQPIATIAAGLGDHPCRLLVDAAQSLGVLPIDVVADRIDLLAAPGHKSLGGPLGTAMLYVAPRCRESFVPLVRGGTGTASQSLAMPSELPDALEAGNLNVPALAGLAVAAERTLARTAGGDRLADLSGRLHQGLSTIDRVRVIGRPGELAVCSFRIEGYDAATVASILDIEFGIEVRSGYHCAAQIHQYLGTSDDGTVRASGGHGTTDQDVADLIDAVNAIAGSSAG